MGSLFLNFKAFPKRVRRVLNQNSIYLLLFKKVDSDNAPTCLHNTFPTTPGTATTINFMVEWIPQYCSMIGLS